MGELQQRLKDDPESMHRVKSDDYIMTEVKEMQIIEQITWNMPKKEARNQWKEIKNRKGT